MLFCHKSNVTSVAARFAIFLLVLLFLWHFLSCFCHIFFIWCCLSLEQCAHVVTLNGFTVIETLYFYIMLSCAVRVHFRHQNCIAAYVSCNHWNNSARHVLIVLSAVQFCALFGIAVAPVCFLIVQRLSCSCYASMLASSLIVFGISLAALTGWCLQPYSIVEIIWNLCAEYGGEKLGKFGICSKAITLMLLLLIMFTCCWKRCEMLLC